LIRRFPGAADQTVTGFSALILMLRFECKGQAVISGQWTLFLAANAGEGS
jgi:hypothetical protein